MNQRVADQRAVFSTTAETSPIAVRSGVTQTEGEFTICHLFFHP